MRASICIACFVRDTFRYFIEQRNAGGEGGEQLGITLLSLNGKILREISGNVKSQKGNMMNLGDDEDLLGKGTESYADPDLPGQ